jgi:hypothetical protein
VVSRGMILFYIVVLTSILATFGATMSDGH